MNAPLLLPHKPMVRGATLRDLSYVASRVRPEDREELDACFEAWTPAGLAGLHMLGMAYIVDLDSNPEAAFGAHEARKGLWTIWAWGSPKMTRCVPRIKDFGIRVLLPAILDDGGYRAEARALKSNRGGNALLKHLGATRRCELPGYGVHGETFVLWDWTRETADVLLNP